jgi:hypothetical protein
MGDIFVKIDAETRALKIEKYSEEGFEAISIGDISEKTLGNTFLKALDDSDIQSSSAQTKIDTEQNFWKHFFQQKAIDADLLIVPELRAYIELFLNNLGREKTNLAAKEEEIQELKKELTKEEEACKSFTSSYAPAVCEAEELTTAVTIESSKTTPLESTKLLELQKARIEWLQSSASIAKNKDWTAKRLDKLQVVINKTSLSDKEDLIAKIKAENANLEINDQKLDEALINAYCSIIGKKKISEKIGNALRTELHNTHILTDHVEIKDFKEKLQNHVKNLTSDNKATDQLYQLLKRDYDQVTQRSKDQYLDNIKKDGVVELIGGIKKETEDSKDMQDEDKKKIFESLLAIESVVGDEGKVNQLKTFLIRNPQILYKDYEGLHVNASINESSREITITDVKAYGLGNKIGLKNGDVIKITDNVDINEAITSIRNFNHEFIKTIKSDTGTEKRDVINELKKIKLQSYDHTRRHLLANYYNSNNIGAVGVVDKTIEDINKEIQNIQQLQAIEVLTREVTALRLREPAQQNQVETLFNLQAQQNQITTKPEEKNKVSKDRLTAQETVGELQPQLDAPSSTITAEDQQAKITEILAGLTEVKNGQNDFTQTNADAIKVLNGKITILDRKQEEETERVLKELKEFGERLEKKPSEECLDTFNADIVERLEGLKAQISEDLKGQLEALQAEVAIHTKTTTKLEEKNKASEDRLTAQEDQVGGLKSQLDELKKGTNATKDRTVALETKLNERNDLMQTQKDNGVLEGKLAIALEEFKRAQEAGIEKQQGVSEEVKAALEALTTGLTALIEKKTSPEDLIKLTKDLERKLGKINAKQEKNKTELEGGLRVQGEGLEASRETQGELSAQLGGHEERLAKLEMLSTTPSTENKSAQGGGAHGPLRSSLGSGQANKLDLWATTEGARGVVEEKEVVGSSERPRSADPGPQGYPQSPSAWPVSNNIGKHSSR